MVATIEQDVRVTTLGNLRLVTGTFTEGGLEIDYSDYLSDVVAAGANFTSLTSTAVLVNMGSGLAPGDTTITVDGINANEVFTRGMTVYSGTTGNKLGVVGGVNAGGTAITLESPGALEGLGDNKNLAVWGACPSVHDFSANVDMAANVVAHVSINETRQVLHISSGRGGNQITTTSVDRDGKWWALGHR